MFPARRRKREVRSSIALRKEGSVWRGARGGVAPDGEQDQDRKQCGAKAHTAPSHSILVERTVRAAGLVGDLLVAHDDLLLTDGSPIVAVYTALAPQDDLPGGPAGFWAEARAAWPPPLRPAGGSPRRWPFTYEVELLLDGVRYVATATWPSDEIAGNEPSVALTFTPDLLSVS